MPYRSGWLSLLFLLASTGCAQHAPPPRAATPPPSKPPAGLHDVRPLRRDPRPTTDEAVAAIVEYHHAAAQRYAEEDAAAAASRASMGRDEGCRFPRDLQIAMLRAELLQNLRRLDLPQAASTLQELYRLDRGRVQADARRVGVRAVPALGLVAAFWVRWIIRRARTTPAGPDRSDGRRFV